MNLQHEEILCKNFMLIIDMYRSRLVDPEKFKIIHIANEQPRTTGKEKIANILRGKKQKAMGKLGGVWDYMGMYFDREYNCERFFFLEAKYGKNKLSQKQKEFKIFLDICNVKNGVFYSPDEAIQYFLDWNIIK